MDLLLKGVLKTMFQSHSVKTSLEFPFMSLVYLMGLDKIVVGCSRRSCTHKTK